LVVEGVAPKVGATQLLVDEDLAMDECEVGHEWDVEDHVAVEGDDTG
jgi:hypothetical protein